MKTLTVEPDSALGKLLEASNTEPVSLVRSGVRYRIVREDVDSSSSYDPARALAGFDRLAGAWQGIDAERMIRELKANRDQDSPGRPRD